MNNKNINKNKTTKARLYTLLIILTIMLLPLFLRPAVFRQNNSIILMI